MTEYLSTRQVAKVTGWSIAKVRQLIDAGKLPAVNTSTGFRPRWEVRKTDLEAFMTPTICRGNSDGEVTK